MKVPNTSYGEDYALGLNFSRQYQIGRRVRRGLPLPPLGRQLRCLTGHRENERTQPLQDRIRTWELQARMAMNKNK